MGYSVFVEKSDFFISKDNFIMKKILGYINKKNF